MREGRSEATSQRYSRQYGPTQTKPTNFISLRSTPPHRIPDFDVLVTNPPYSGDHLERCLSFAARCGKPFALLLPNYVYNKNYYRSAVREDLTRPFYLIPKQRYTYTVPDKYVKGSRERVGTSPFFTFWYLGGCRERTDDVVKDVRQGLGLGERLAESIEGLPNDVRDITDTVKKRKNPKARRKEKIKKAKGLMGVQVRQSSCGGGEGGGRGNGDEGGGDANKKKKKRF